MTQVSAAMRSLSLLSLAAAVANCGSPGPHIDFVEIPTADIRSAKTFYGSVLVISVPDLEETYRRAWSDQPEGARRAPERCASSWPPAGRPQEPRRDARYPGGV
jgi:hypothetical protein